MDLTFLQGACRHGLAVGALELIKVRSHFNLIDDAFLQIRERYVPLWGHLQVLYLPRPRGGQTRRLPEQNTVALNKLGWVLHLRRRWEEEERIDRNEDMLRANDEGGVYE